MPGLSFALQPTLDFAVREHCPASSTPRAFHGARNGKSFLRVNADQLRGVVARQDASVMVAFYFHLGCGWQEEAVGGVCELPGTKSFPQRYVGYNRGERREEW
jgi:hypothetical protein